MFGNYYIIKCLHRHISSKQEIESGMAMKNNNDLELIKALLGSGSLRDLQDVEVNSLSEGPAFTSSNDVADLDVSANVLFAISLCNLLR